MKEEKLSEKDLVIYNNLINQANNLGISEFLYFHKDSLCVVRWNDFIWSMPRKIKLLSFKNE